jgi:hypothetical protein
MLDGHSSVLWSGAIYIWGGKDFENGATTAAARRATASYSNAMYVLNPSECISKPSAALERLRLSDEAVVQNDGRKTTAFMPSGRAYHNAALYGKLMLITGGLTDESEQAQDLSNIPAFDLERRVWAVKASFGDVPCARCHHVTVLYGDTLMVHGGYPVLNERHRELTTEEVSSMQHAMYDTHELNISTMRWRRIQTAHSPALWGHSAIMYNKNVVVFGGVDVIENSESGSVAVWHTEKKQWRWADFENLELRCALHTAVQDGGRMFVFSGISFKSHNKLRSLFEFNLEFGSWRELQPKGAPPLGRVGHTAVVFNQTMIVIGGSVENPSEVGGGSGGQPERAVHLYNTALNEWRTCALVPPSSEAPETSLGKFIHREKSWSSKPVDGGMQAAVKEEWDNTAQQVKETIARAKAIQALADAAAGSVSGNTAAGLGGRSASPQPGILSGGRSGLRPSTGNPDPQPQYRPDVPMETIVPYDDSRKFQRQPQQGTPGGPQRDASMQMQPPAASPNMKSPRTQFSGSLGRESSVTQTERSQAEEAFEKIRDLRQGTNNEEARRVIEALQKENERLRSQLEDFRHTNDQRNPYEVPMYNAASRILTLAPDEGVSKTPRLGQSNLGDNVPRLNLNAAEPPRAVAGASGFMSRGAVSALVQSSLNNIPASTSLNIAQPAIRTAGLDPMSFLTQPSYQPPHTASGGATPWHPNQYQPPQSYDQLLSRVNISAPTQTSAVPLALQPLLTLLGSGAPILQNPQMPQLSNTSFGGYQGMSSSFAAPRSPLDSAPPAQAQSTSAVLMAPTSVAQSPPASRTRAPSLNKLVHGHASMLSLPSKRR